MKKKLLCILLTTTVVLCMGACDSGDKSTESHPPDLTGTWKSEENDGSYQEATITDNTIEINWMSDGGKTSSIYWVGTYEPATEYVNEYTWTSERDTQKTDTALLASTDDTKEFFYKNGRISYEASAMGTTTTVELTKE